MLAAGFILALFILSVFIMQQTLPLPAAEVLEDPVGPTALFLLAAIGELLLLPGALALYFSLKDVKKTPMFMATGLLAVAVPMFLASRGLIMSLSQIRSRYMDTTNETMKAAYLASAELALETQNIYAMMGLILLCVASIIIGLFMLKGGLRQAHRLLGHSCKHLYSLFPLRSHLGDHNHNTIYWINPSSRLAISRWC